MSAVTDPPNAFFTATSMIGFLAGAGIAVRNSILSARPRRSVAQTDDLGDRAELAGILFWRRYRAGGTSNARLKALLNAASDS